MADNETIDDIIDWGGHIFKLSVAWVGIVALLAIIGLGLEVIVQIL